MDITLAKPLARNSAADEYDVRLMKKALNAAGYYMPPEDIGITGIPDAQMFEAIKSLQKESGLEPTGIVKPGDETVEALREVVNARKDDLYVWRTVGDERVRESHAALEGEMRRWDDYPRPAEEVNCRCWAGPVVIDLDKLFPDAIELALSPLDFVGAGLLAKGAAGAGSLAARLLASRLRDVSWIRNVPKGRLQKKFKHARIFGIKGNQNNQTLESFKKALENHVKSPDTKVIKGTLHKDKVIHYYNTKTRINVIRDMNGNFVSAWKLSPKQHFYMMKNGNIGGG